MTNLYKLTISTDHGDVVRYPHAKDEREAISTGLIEGFAELVGRRVSGTRVELAAEMDGRKG